MKVQLARMWTAKCQDCDWLSGEPGTEMDVNPEAKKHYRETKHQILVRRIDSWLYRKPEAENG